MTKKVNTKRPTEEEIKTLLRRYLKNMTIGKHPRWAMDGALGDKFRDLGTQWAQEMMDSHKEIQKWAKESRR